MQPISRDLDGLTLMLMADHIGDALMHMALGEHRWLHEHDVLAGRASMLAGRSLIEFLVGRSGRYPYKKDDIWPTDYVPSWSVTEEDVRLLHVALRWVDGALAHLSLRRAQFPEERPEDWHASVLRIVGLMSRFADEASGGIGADSFRDSVRRAETLIARGGSSG